MRVFFETVGVLTTYNLDLPNALSKVGVRLYVDSQNNLLRVLMLRAKFLNQYRPNLRFISIVHHMVPDSQLRSYLKKSEILHFNEYNAVSSKFMTLGAGRPRIFVLHSAPYSENFYQTFPKNVEVFVAPSKFTAGAEAVKIGRKPVVIHHGVNTFLFNAHYSASKARESVGLPMKGKVVLWNDRISPNKDLGTFLKAIALVSREEKDVYFYIKARTVEREYLEQNKLLIRRTLELKNVRMHIQWLPHEKLPLLYRAADVFVSTSILENFGLRYVEAMACGIPVVAANAATAPEVLGDAGVLFDSGNEKDLAEKLSFLLNDSNVRSKLSAKGIKRVNQHFTWSIAAKKYLSLYESIT
jgi:glycosyltransferase involved in cell wall biosynthesis